jgi:peptidoglycan/LPS O-acetylase OafA/YrhL
MSSLMHLKNRKFGLDIIRATAIISVFLCHVMDVFYAHTAGQTELIFNCLTWAGGYYGVEIFFVLSGFLIGGIFIEKVVEPLHQNNARSLKPLILDFWIRRWIRTLPSYYLFVFINILLLPIYDSEINSSIITRFLFFLQGFSHLNTSFFGVSWSLAVEEWFYLLLPFFFLLFNLGNKKNKGRQNFVFSFLLLLIIPWILKLRLLFIIVDTKNLESTLHYTTQYKLDSMFYGLLLSYFYTKGLLRNWMERNAKLIFVIGLIGLLFSFVYACFYVLKANPNPLAVLFLGPLCSISIMACFPLLNVYIPKHNNKLLLNSITKISLISFSLYLCHVPILHITRYLFDQWHCSQTMLNSSLLVVLNIVLSYLASLLLYKKFEIPVMQWREVISQRMINKRK